MICREIIVKVFRCRPLNPKVIHAYPVARGLLYAGMEKKGKQMSGRCLRCSIKLAGTSHVLVVISNDSEAGAGAASDRGQCCEDECDELHVSFSFEAS